MRAATNSMVVVLLGLGCITSVVAQPSFRPPSYAPPFKDEGGLLPGGRQAFGEALAERMKDSAQRAAQDMARSSCASPPQVRLPGTQGVCTDYSLGNVSLARYSSNFGPIVVIIKKED